jgi:hypothetical protein
MEHSQVPIQAIIESTSHLSDSNHFVYVAISKDQLQHAIEALRNVMVKYRPNAYTTDEYKQCFQAYSKAVRNHAAIKKGYYEL